MGCESRLNAAYLPVLGISMHGIDRAANPLVLPDVVPTNLLIARGLPALTCLQPQTSQHDQATSLYTKLDTDSSTKFACFAFDRKASVHIY